MLFSRLTARRLPPAATGVLILLRILFCTGSARASSRRIGVLRIATIAAAIMWGVIVVHGVAHGASLKAISDRAASSAPAMVQTVSLWDDLKRWFGGGPKAPPKTRPETPAQMPPEQPAPAKRAAPTPRSDRKPVADRSPPLQSLPPPQTTTPPGSTPPGTTSAAPVPQPAVKPKPPQAKARDAAPPVAAASLDQMIGQMLILGFQGTSARQKWPRQVAAQLAAGKIGGVLFLGHNTRTKSRELVSADDIKGLVGLFQSARSRHVPLIMVDQEGGQVARLKPAITGLGPDPSPQRLAERNLNPKQLRAHYAVRARLLKKWGFNVNLAPVVDLNVNRSNPIIGRIGRSYSDKPGAVTDFAAAVVDAHRQAGVLTALKHFPGHGSSRRDTHKGFVDISQSWSRLELEPYARLIASGRADMVMVGHLFLKQFQDREGGADPATFSRKLINGVLRRELGFKEVVISDDMEMGAIQKHYKYADAVVRAIAAGIDLLVISNTAKPRRNMPDIMHKIIREASARDPRIKARIVRSYKRIMRLKRRLNLAKLKQFPETMPAEPAARAAAKPNR